MASSISVVCGPMELLIALNIILLLILIGTFLSLKGRVRLLEEDIRRRFREVQDATTGRSRVMAEHLEAAGTTAETAAAGEHAEQHAEMSETAAAETAAQEAGPGPAGGGRISALLRPRTREEWETLIGGKLLNRLGALALVFGVGFFLKYAFDNNWLNETARVMLGAATGLLLLGGGQGFHRRHMRVFAQGLTGAGAAILYLSIYAAYDFYHLIPQPLAFLLMAVVTAANLLLALRYDARAIALLGWAGGFLTPLLLVTADLNTLGLFVYVTLLNAGLIFILLKRPGWRRLEPLCINATYGTYLTWSFRADLPDGLGTALMFLTLWWAMFVGVNLYRSATGDGSGRLWRWMATVFNAAGFYWMLMRLSRHMEGMWTFFGIRFASPESAWIYTEGVITVVLSLAYFALTAWIMRRTDDSPAAAPHATVAILLAIRAPASFFVGFGVLIVWALEALVLFGFGTHYPRQSVRHAGTALFVFLFVGIALASGAYVVDLVSSHAPVRSLQSGVYWVVAGSLLACAGMLQDRTESKNDHRLRTMLHLAWTFLLLAWGTFEVLDYFQDLAVSMESGSAEHLRNAQQLAVSGVWLFGAALVMIMGRWMDIRALRAAAIVYFGAAVVKAFLFDLMMLDTLYRIMAFLGLSAILIAVSYLYYRNRPTSRP